MRKINKKLNTEIIFPSKLFWTIIFMILINPCSGQDSNDVDKLKSLQEEVDKRGLMIQVLENHTVKLALKLEYLVQIFGGLELDSKNAVNYILLIDYLQNHTNLQEEDEGSVIFLINLNSGKFKSLQKIHYVGVDKETVNSIAKELEYFFTDTSLSFDEYIKEYLLFALEIKNGRFTKPPN